MSPHTRYLDLRSCPPGISVHTYAFYALKNLEPGTDLTMISAEDPLLLLNQLQLQLRNRLWWECAREDKSWNVHIRRREDTEALTLQDILSRDHERLDGLFVQMLARMRAYGTSAAMPSTLEFIQGLRRHISVENNIIAPAFTSLHGSEEHNPVATMLREHEDILNQAQIIEELFQQAAPDQIEAEIWLGLLAAALSKHEHREETRLFALWDALLNRRTDASALIHRVKTGLVT